MNFRNLRVNLFLCAVLVLLTTGCSNGGAQEPFDVVIMNGRVMDPETGRTRVRMVNTRSDAFRAARALQTRVESEDLRDSDGFAAIAQAAKLEPDQARRRYAPLA